MEAAKMLTPIKKFFTVEPTNSKELSRKAIIIFCFGCLFPLVIATLLSLPSSDAIRRYIPMAEAFARGEFELVMHPRFPYLFPSLAGILVFCKIPALWALTLISSISNGGICVMVYLTGRRVFNHLSGILGFIVYLFCSRSTLLSSFGLREPLVGLGYFLIAYGAILATSQKSPTRTMIYWLCGGIILANTRAEGIFIVGFLLIIMLAYDIVRFRIPYRTILTAVLIAASTLPTLYGNYQTIGYPVPAVQIHDIMSKTQAGKNILAMVYNPNNRLEQNKPKQTASKTSKTYFIDFVDASNPTGLAALKEIGKGLGSYIVIPVFLLFLLRCKRKVVKPEELILAGGVVLYTSLVTFQMMATNAWQLTMSTRYLYPCAPLLMPGAGFLVFKIHQYWQAKFPRHYSTAWACLVLIAVCLISTLGDLAPRLPLSTRRQADLESVHHAARVIKSDFASMDQQKLKRFPISLADYHNSSRPIVHAAGTDRLHFVGSLIGGQTAFEKNIPPADYIVYGANKYDSDELAGYVLIDSYFNAQKIKIRTFRRNDLK